MSLKDIAAALEAIVGVTVHYGFIPDDEVGSDTMVSMLAFPLGRPSHEFSEPLPALTPFGIALHVRGDAQDAVMTLCASGYEGLLSAGYTAVVPPVSLGKQVGRFEAIAQVEAHEVRT